MAPPPHVLYTYFLIEQVFFYNSKDVSLAVLVIRPSFVHSQANGFISPSSSLFHLALPPFLPTALSEEKKGCQALGWAPDRRLTGRLP